METKEHRHGLATGNAAQNANVWQYKLIVDIRRLFSENCHQSGVGWLEWTILQFYCCYTSDYFISFRNKLDIIVHYDKSLFC